MKTIFNMSNLTGPLGNCLKQVPTNEIRLFLICYIIFTVLALSVTFDAIVIKRVDHIIFNWAHETTWLRSNWTEHITRLGGTAWVKKGCWLSVVLLYLLRKPRYVPVLLIGVYGAIGLNGYLKEALERPRPLFQGATFAGYSFPSGHTASVTSIVGFWVLFVMREIRKKKVKRAIGVVLGFLAAVVGISRVFLLAHWGSDVVAGWAFAVAWSLLVFWFAFSHCWESSSRSTADHMKKSLSRGSLPEDGPQNNVDVCAQYALEVTTTTR